LKHQVFSYVALVTFRVLDSQLSGFREKRVLRNHYAKLTPKTKLEGQDLFFWYLSPNLPGMILDVSRLLRAHFRRYCCTELNMNWKQN